MRIVMRKIEFDEVMMSINEVDSRKESDVKLNVSSKIAQDRVKMNVEITCEQLYVYLIENEFDDKRMMIWMMSDIRKDACNRTRSHREKVVINKIEKLITIAKTMMIKMNNVIRDLRSSEKNIDIERVAERRLYRLRQIESTTTYTKRFRTIDANVRWNDDFLASRYHQELKKNVKKKMTKEDRFTMLRKMINVTIRIDNDLYEQRKKKFDEKKIEIKNNHVKSQKSWDKTKNMKINDVDAKW